MIKLYEAAEKAAKAIDDRASYDHLEDVVAPDLREAMDFCKLDETTINQMWEKACKDDDYAVYSFVAMIEGWYGIK